MVGDTKRTITEPSTYTDNFYVSIMIAGIITDLFKAAQGRKISNGISKNNFALKGQTGRKSGHILLGNTGINELLRKVSKQEVVIETDDVPMALNILKLLEIYDAKGRGNFYGVVSIKIVGVKTRNLKISEQSFKLCDEKIDYLRQ